MQINRSQLTTIMTQSQREYFYPLSTIYLPPPSTNLPPTNYPHSTIYHLPTTHSLPSTSFLPSTIYLLPTIYHLTYHLPSLPSTFYHPPLLYHLPYLPFTVYHLPPPLGLVNICDSSDNCHF